ncbi:lipoprotein precursor [Tenacibaculum sp. 190130A14a]|uniref:Calx-beta domain-containing protein n=1 Tax=Tenacibaculum polynesiense TaxID=3137857 RepID=A0ABM9PAY1_9FLAO
MKKIKLSIYTLLLSIAFIGCNSSNTELVEGTVTPTTQVTIGFTDSNNNQDVLEDGGNVSFQVSLSKALPYDITVEFEVESSDASLMSSTISEVNYEEKVVISAGQKTADVALSFVDDGKSDAVETYTVNLKNAYTTSTLTTHFVTGSNAADSMSRVINVYDSLPTVIEADKGTVSLLLEWPGAEDLDLYLRSEPTIFSTVLANSWFSQPESVDITEAMGDGDFYLGLDNFNLPTPYDVRCTLKIVLPDTSTETLMTDLVTTETAAANGEPDVWFKITRRTDGDKSTYSIIKIR